MADADWAPTPEWLDKVAAEAGERLLAMPYQLLGPAGRILVDGIRAAQRPDELPGNVIPFPAGGRR